jgi:integrase
LDRFPARPVEHVWAATQQTRDLVLQRLMSAPFTAEGAKNARHRRQGLDLLLGWLAEQPGHTWQQRWLASGADDAGMAWRRAPQHWLHQRGDHSESHHAALCAALVTAICADVLRPSLRWFAAGCAAHGSLAPDLARCRDPGGFAGLRALCDADPRVSVTDAQHTIYRAALIVAAKGGVLSDLTVGDCLQLLEVEAAVQVKLSKGSALFYRLLKEMGIFGGHAPDTLRALRTGGQCTPEQLIDRYRLACRAVRDLLVDYLRERQPALDYTSLRSLANYLGKRFWQDLERHHPGINSLRLPVEVADAWKLRLRRVDRTIITATADRTTLSVPRVNYRECLIPVRAFYLDLAQWAIEEPARWGPWVAPCPIRPQETNPSKAKRQHKARMDTRTRERLPVLPLLVRTVEQRRNDAEALLQAARQTPPGETVTTAGQNLTRSLTPHAAADKIWVDDPITGHRRDLGLEEDHAFWAWAAIEVLRATGIRVEELLELNHHSLIQYRLPNTAELVPLLQIAPSKTDAERLLLVSPELADVLATVIRRVRGNQPALPLVPAYDSHECLWSTPAPRLFQRRHSCENRAITADGLRRILTTALTHSGLLDPADGRPLRFTPHDFRRIFITDAVLNGLPPHIAQIIAGHKDINVTLAYKAVYPDEAIQAHLAYLARRRALRPSDEYRAPTDEEWQQFLGDFERRKVSIGTCARSFGTPCIHEHACVRCPMLWPDPHQRPRLLELHNNIQARINEAEHEGWLGEVEGLHISLTAAKAKLAQIDHRSATTVSLPTPTHR